MLTLHAELGVFCLHCSQSWASSHTEKESGVNVKVYPSVTRHLTSVTAQGDIVKLLQGRRWGSRRRCSAPILALRAGAATAPAREPRHSAGSGPAHWQAFSTPCTPETPGAERPRARERQAPRPSHALRVPGARASTPRVARGHAVSGARRLGRRTPERRSARRPRRPPPLRQPRDRRTPERCSARRPRRPPPLRQPRGQVMTHSAGKRQARRARLCKRKTRRARRAARARALTAPAPRPPWP